MQTDIHTEGRMSISYKKYMYLSQTSNYQYQERKKPAWKLKMKNDIETKRKELSIIAELEKGSQVKDRTVRNIEKYTKSEETKASLT